MIPGGCDESEAAGPTLLHGNFLQATGTCSMPLPGGPDSEPGSLGWTRQGTKAAGSDSLSF